MTLDLSPYVGTVLDMIRRAVRDGRVPREVKTWADLYGHIDADSLLLDAEVPWPTGEYGYMDAVEDAVSVRLTRGEHLRQPPA